MIIAKFGGTSVSTAKNLQTIVGIVKKSHVKGVVLVVSAIRGVTDLLLSYPVASVTERKKIFEQIEKLHRNLIHDYWLGVAMPDIEMYLRKCLGEINIAVQKEKNTKALSDRIVSYGEILSSFIVTKVLQSAGIASQQVIATDCIVTNENFMNAEFLPKETLQHTKRGILPLLQKSIVPVVTGFIGRTKKGDTTTLGRGGSDYSAAILGYALDADEIQIWTDVDGIFTTDPRMVKNALLLKNVSFREASELAAFGAKVLHPRTIKPAITKGIPVRVLNTLNPASSGTVITHQKQKRIAAIAAKQKITLVTIYSMDMLQSYGFLEKVFAIFAKNNISIDLVSVSEVSVSVTLDNDEHIVKAVDELKTFTSVKVSTGHGIVSLIGEGIVSLHHIFGTIFSLLEKANIIVRMISLGASDINISIVIATEDIDRAVNLLHKKIVLGGNNS